MVVRNVVIGQKVSQDKKKLAKFLRRNMTEAESLLWQRLRGNRLSGFHFRRQQIIKGFIVDFYCHKAALVVEVDGGIHNDTTFSDYERDLILQELGFNVLRVKNGDIKNNLFNVLKSIEAACHSAL